MSSFRGSSLFCVNILSFICAVVVVVFVVVVVSFP